MEKEIITVFVHPPIPMRQFDWCAYYDGEEESGRRGWGLTEREAVADLRDNEE
jgi:hypothetical protein